MLELNPKAQVPVLVDGDLVLWDSTVIVEYLDEIAPDRPMLPREPRDRARCRMAELHADEVFFPVVWTLIDGVFYGTEGKRAAVTEAKQRLAALYTELDKALDGRVWIAAEEFNAADVAYRLATLFATTLGAGPSVDLTRFTAWQARIDQRPSIAREIEGLMKAAASLAS